MKPRLRLVIGSFAFLVVGLAAVSLLIAGNGRAQEADQPVKEKHVETVREIISEGELPEGWVPFPFEAALRDMIDDGRLTQEDVDQIMSDLAERTDAITVERSGGGDQSDEVEVLVEIKIVDDGRDMSDLFQQTLDQAVADGLLTSEDAAEVMQKVHEANQ